MVGVDNGFEQAHREIFCTAPNQTRPNK